MKSLIILKSLAKSQKLDWVKNEELENYFIDIDLFRRVYSSPDLITPSQEILSKGYGDIVYRRFMEVLITRMSKGCLVVIDPENEAVTIFETLALIFGYTVFWVIFDVPQDYVVRSLKYNPSCYPIKRRAELEKEVTSFLSISFGEERLKITSYQDVLNYWSLRTINVNPSDRLLFVGDLHSNYSLMPKDFSPYRLVVFLGDYIDGYEEGGSRKITDTILETRSSNVIWLEGNHELRLRRYLGIKALAGTGRKDIIDFLYRNLTPDFLDKTAKEYDDLGPQAAKNYLQKLNRKLKIFAILDTTNTTLFCTHAGLKFPEQIDPRYVGNLVYGNRDMNRIDREFSERSGKKGIWSVHAHCNYLDIWEPNRWEGVCNLNPHDETEIVTGEFINNKWTITPCQNEKLKLPAPRLME